MKKEIKEFEKELRARFTDYRQVFFQEIVDPQHITRLKEFNKETISALKKWAKLKLKDFGL